MKKGLVLIIVIGLFSSIFAPLPLKADVEIRSISIDPPVVNESSIVTIRFVLKDDLPGGGRIFVKFPQGFLVPPQISTSAVDVGGFQPASVEVSFNSVTITTSQKIQKNQGAAEGGYPLTFLLNAGIKNPSIPDAYTFEVWTSQEPNHIKREVFIGLAGSGTLVRNVTAALGSYVASKRTAYTISFNVSTEGTLIANNGDFVDIYFPRGTVLPDSFDASSVIFNGKSCTRVERVDRRVRIYLPENWVVFSFQPATVIFREDFGIINPEFTGSYAIQVSTSKDTGLAFSNVYTITGTSVLILDSSLSPSMQMNPASLRIKLKQSASSEGMTRDISKVNIKFPWQFTLPANVKPGAIAVNGVPSVRVEKREEILSVFVPINIDRNTDIEIVISKEFGIVNPAETGSYELFVNTSSDAQLVSFLVQITPSAVSEVSVTVSNSSAGQLSSYLLTFRTGYSGKLYAGIDRINIVFPLGTTIPSIISTSSVLVNGVPTTLLEISGTTIAVTPPLEIPAASIVSVEFRESAGLRNPVVAGNYVVQVHTSKEQTAVASSQYSIKNVPVTSLSINPLQPDGLSGFYKTAPYISFSATSATDPNPSVYYYFDTNQPVLYAGTPVKAPEGLHTLFYYAIDKDGRKEDTKSFQFKVDSIPPIISITKPANGAILSSFKVLVQGHVDPGSVVEVNSISVEVDGVGNFQVEITLSNNPDVITVKAFDIAGNESQQSLTVGFDTTPPVLTLTKPVMFQQVSKLPLLVEGKTEPGAGVTVNGMTATVAEDGSFSFPLTYLKEGELSSIEVVATDTAGNSTRKSVSVKYSKSVTMILQVGNAFALVNGQTYTLEAAPLISSGRTMVPLRFVGEAFGAEFTYEAASKTIDIVFGSDKIRMQIGKKTAVVNGKEVVLDVAPFIVNGRTLVPIRFISETFGANVAWDAATKTVTIVYPKN